MERADECGIIGPYIFMEDKIKLVPLLAIDQKRIQAEGLPDLVDRLEVLLRPCDIGKDSGNCRLGQDWSGMANECFSERRLSLCEDCKQKSKGGGSYEKKRAGLKTRHCGDSRECCQELKRSADRYKGSCKDKLRKEN